VANSAVDLAAINTAGDDDDDTDDDDVGIISAVLTDAIPVLVTDDVLTVVPDADGDTELLLVLLLLLLSQLKIVSTVAIVVGVDVTLLLLFSSFLPLLKKDLFLFLFLYEDDFNIPRCWGDLVIGELLLLLLLIGVV